MCGRFVSREQAAIEREYNIRVRNPFERVYNAAPTMLLPVIRTTPGRTGPDASTGGSGELEALSMRWGLIPSWWSRPTAPTSTINARSEEAATKPMWRSAVRHARCLVPTLGWYEWRVTGEGKVPYFIHAPAMAGFCFAGLWSQWKNPAGETQLSFAILTRAASDPLKAIHDRMPVVIGQAAWDEWLSDWPGEHAARLAANVAKSLNEFEYYPVSRYVNAPRNQGERCIQPATA
jgi:putative SOS response-associated peptidase YedK